MVWRRSEAESVTVAADAFVRPASEASVPGAESAATTKNVTPPTDCAAQSQTIAIDVSRAATRNPSHRSRPQASASSYSSEAV